MCMEATQDLTTSRSEARFVGRQFGSVITEQFTTREECEAHLATMPLEFEEQRQWLEIREIRVWVLGTEDLARQAAVQAEHEASLDRARRAAEARRQEEQIVWDSFSFGG